MPTYRCNRCAQDHEGPPLGYGTSVPHRWHKLSKEDQAKAVLDREACVINGQYFYLRANIHLPILHSTDLFTYAVWISLNRWDFARAVTLWKDKARLSEPPYMGYLATSLPGYPETLNLRVQTHSREVGVRPFVELEVIDHPLVLEQQHGISPQRIQELAELLLHGPV